MTKPVTPLHTVEDEWLASYCAGSLSPAKDLVVACQAAINPAIAEKLNQIGSVGGVLLETAKGESLSDDFMAGLFRQIDDESSAVQPASDAQKLELDVWSWLPKPLTDFLTRANKPAKWKKLGFGMERLTLMKQGREKLYLLKSRPGLKMPMHSHHGEEWALILQGGYRVGGQDFVRGDLHREDETCTHRPVVDDHGEACITLVASEGGVKFRNPFLSLFKPILGI